MTYSTKRAVNYVMHLFFQCSPGALNQNAKDWLKTVEIVQMKK